MIKTVSFAPPRPRKKQSSASRASGSLAPASANIAENLSSIGISRSTRKTLVAGGSPTPADSSTITVPAKSSKAKSAPIESNGGLTLAFDFEEPAPAAKPAKTVAAAVIAPPKATTAKTTQPKAVAAPKAPTKTVVTKPVVNELPPIVKTNEPIAEVAAPKAKKATTPKNKRVKIPENLAEQYGAKLSKRVESGVVDVPVEEAPKKRMTKVEREARKQLLRPDDGLLQRLQRTANLIPAQAKQPPRQKGWKFECGRCGRTSYFQTANAGICECGAIAVRD